MPNTSELSERPIQENKLNRQKVILGAGALVTSLNFAYSDQKNTSELPAPKFTLAPHLNASFPKSIPVEERIATIVKAGAKAYQIGSVEKFNLEKLKTSADKAGLRCASIAGTGTIGLSTGLTHPGKEKIFLDFFQKSVNHAKQLGAQNLVSFVGEKTDSISWEKQYSQIIAGLRKAGDIAGEAGVYFTLEPLNHLNRPKMSVLSAQDGFKIIRDVNHPYVKLDFDIYHLQISEGNLTSNLKEGLSKKWIQFVEVGDVPGRYQPGTGEINFRHIFNELRIIGYDGYIGMEHRAKPNFLTAFSQIKELAGLS